jgi:hypothetical protein
MPKGICIKFHAATKQKALLRVGNEISFILRKPVFGAMITKFYCQTGNVA